MQKRGFTYIMANDRPTLYVGTTSNLVKRVWEHRSGKGSAFTSKYKLYKLVYYEVFDTMLQAIIREKQIKDMNRNEKLEMIKSVNSSFEDLYATLTDLCEV